MRNWLIGGAVVLVLAWFGFKDFVYRSVLQANTPPGIETLNYSEADAWAVRPDDKPPGGWATPWGVDVFLVAPPTGLSGLPGWIDARRDDHRKVFARGLAAVQAAVPSDVPVYAPHYHPLSAVEDRDHRKAGSPITGLTAAFNAYLATDNRDRAVLLAVDERALPYAGEILTRVTEADLVERFAGLVVFGATELDDISCSPSLAGACVQTIDMQSHGNPLGVLLPRLPGRIVRRSVVDAGGTAEAISVQAAQVSAWLDENAAKPAEPLGDFETIEIAPVYSPDETPNSN